MVPERCDARVKNLGDQCNKPAQKVETPFENQQDLVDSKEMRKLADITLRILHREAAVRLDGSTMEAANSTMDEVILEYLRAFRNNHGLETPVLAMVLESARTIDQLAAAMVATLRKLEANQAKGDDAELVAVKVSQYFRTLSAGNTWA